MDEVNLFFLIVLAYLAIGFTFAGTCMKYYQMRDVATVAFLWPVFAALAVIYWVIRKDYE